MKLSLLEELRLKMKFGKENQDLNLRINEFLANNNNSETRVEEDDEHDLYRRNLELNKEIEQALRKTRAIKLVLQSLIKS